MKPLYIVLAVVGSLLALGVAVFLVFPRVTNIKLNGAFTVSEVRPGDVVQLTAPGGGAFPVDLMYSADGGKSYTSIARGLRTVSWQVPSELYSDAVTVAAFVLGTRKIRETAPFAVRPSVALNLVAPGVTAAANNNLSIPVSTTSSLVTNTNLKMEVLKPSGVWTSVADSAYVVNLAAKTVVWSANGFSDADTCLLRFKTAGLVEAGYPREILSNESASITFTDTAATPAPVKPIVSGPATGTLFRTLSVAHRDSATTAGGFYRGQEVSIFVDATAAYNDSIITWYSAPKGVKLVELQTPPTRGDLTLTQYTWTIPYVDSDAIVLALKTKSRGGASITIDLIKFVTILSARVIDDHLSLNVVHGGLFAPGTEDSDPSEWILRDGEHQISAVASTGLGQTLSFPMRDIYAGDHTFILGYMGTVSRGYTFATVGNPAPAIPPPPATPVSGVKKQCHTYGGFSAAKIIDCCCLTKLCHDGRANPACANPKKCVCR
jgi:hypothetical protein